MIYAEPMLVERAKAHYLVVLIEEDLRDKLARRRWYQGVGRLAFADWWRANRLHELRVEIRTLVRILRAARKAVR